MIGSAVLLCRLPPAAAAAAAVLTPAFSCRLLGLPCTTFLTMAPKSIAVIGAGATGLLVAAELKNAGGGAAAVAAPPAALPARICDARGLWLAA